MILFKWKKNHHLDLGFIQSFVFSCSDLFCEFHIWKSIIYAELKRTVWFIVILTYPSVSLIIYIMCQVFICRLERMNTFFFFLFLMCCFIIKNKMQNNKTKNEYLFQLHSTLPILCKMINFLRKKMLWTIILSN